jgi:hypothetical protein
MCSAVAHRQPSRTDGPFCPLQLLCPIQCQPSAFLWPSQWSVLPICLFTVLASQFCSHNQFIWKWGQSCRLFSTRNTLRAESVAQAQAWGPEFKRQYCQHLPPPKQKTNKQTKKQTKSKNHIELKKQRPQKPLTHQKERLNSTRWAPCPKGALSHHGHFCSGPFRDNRLDTYCPRQKDLQPEAQLVAGSKGLHPQARGGGRWSTWHPAKGLRLRFSSSLWQEKQALP